MDHDVVICGGGPAGLSTAIRCAELGQSVLLIERSRVFGEPVHDSGGTLSGALLDLGLDRRIFASDISGITFVGPKGRRIDLDAGQTLGYVLERRDLNKEMASLAASKGVDIRLAETVVSAAIDNGRLTGVRTKSVNGDALHEGKVFIDATGVGAVLAKQRGLHPGTGMIDMAIGCQYEMANASIDKESYIELYFGEGYAPSGYGWLFPKGRDRAIAGLGTITRAGSPRNLPFDLLDSFIRNERATAGQLTNAQPLEYHSGTFPIGPMFREFVMGNLVVIGDAGCQGSPHLGEGIRFAVDIGRIAGEVCSSYVDRGCRSDRDLLAIERRVRKEVYPNYDLMLKLFDHAAGLDDPGWRGVLRRIEELSRTEKGRDLIYRVIAGTVTKRDILTHAGKLALILFK